jgi:hypothetical protein
MGDVGGQAIIKCSVAVLAQHLFAPGVALVRISFLLLAALAMRGGIRQRLQVDEATEAPPAARTTVRGGLQQRFCPASSSSTAPRAETAPHSAKRRKLEAEPEDVSNLPLNTSLRRDWARGILPSNKVLEYAAGASSQGARGLELFAGGGRNAHRRVVAALGYPEKAPRLSWIEILVAGGGVQPQPILCPIDTLEALLEDPVKLQKHMRGEDSNVQDLWYGLSGTKVFNANKMHINICRSLAITLHGDLLPRPRQTVCSRSVGVRFMRVAAPATRRTSSPL